MSAQNLIAAQAEIFTSLMVAYVGNYGKKNQDENCSGMNADRFFTTHCKAQTAVGWKRESNTYGQLRTKTRGKNVQSVPSIA